MFPLAIPGIARQGINPLGRSFLLRHHPVAPEPVDAGEITVLICGPALSVSSQVIGGSISGATPDRSFSPPLIR
jgi:hypothetical protein